MCCKLGLLLQLPQPQELPPSSTVLLRRSDEKCDTVCGAPMIEAQTAASAGACYRRRRRRRPPQPLLPPSGSASAVLRPAGPGLPKLFHGGGGYQAGGGAEGEVGEGSGLKGGDGGGGGGGGGEVELKPKDGAGGGESRSARQLRRGGVDGEVGVATRAGCPPGAPPPRSFRGALLGSTCPSHRIQRGKSLVGVGQCWR